MGWKRRGHLHPFDRQNGRFSRGRKRFSHPVQFNPGQGSGERGNLRKTGNRAEKRSAEKAETIGWEAIFSKARLRIKAQRADTGKKRRVFWDDFMTLEAINRPESGGLMGAS